MTDKKIAIFVNSVPLSAIDYIQDSYKNNKKNYNNRVSIHFLNYKKYEI